MFDGISMGAEGASRAMSDIVGLAGALLTQIGAVVGTLGEVYEWADKLGMTALFGALGDDKEEAMKEVNQGAAQSHRDLAAAADEAAAAQQRLWAATDSYNQAMRGTFDANLALAGGFRELKAQVEANGTSLDINTESGYNNTRSLSSLIEAANRAGESQRQLAIAAGDTANADARGDAARNASLASIRAQAEAMGFDRAQVDALIRSLASVPTGRMELEYRIRVATELVNAAGIDTSGMSLGQIASRARIINKGMARGGPVRKGETYIVGENRAELFVPDENGTIIPEVPAPGSPRPWPGTSSGGGGGVVFAPVFNIQTLDPRAASVAVMDAIGEWERTNGKGWRS
jgi:hypothetical protein